MGFQDTVARKRARMINSGLVMAIALALVAQPGPVSAQSAPDNEASGPTPDYLEQLKLCQTKQDDAARLACFDSAVTAMIAASDEGDVQVIDREDVRETKRKLFGFTLPETKLFAGDQDDAVEKDKKLFETTITSARYVSAKRARFTTAEGAVWEMKSIPRRLRKIKPGDTVQFKKASFGYFFARIAGQMGVKAKRIQ